MLISRLNSQERKIAPELLTKFEKIDKKKVLEKVINLDLPDERISHIYQEIKNKFDDKTIVKYFKFKMRELTHVGRLRVYLFGKKNNIEGLVSECVKFFKICAPDISIDTKLNLWDFKRTIIAIVLSGKFTEYVFKPSNPYIVNSFDLAPLIHNTILYTVVSVVGVAVCYFDFQKKNHRNIKIRELESFYRLDQLDKK